MGGVKRMLEEEHARGWSALGKLVCDVCVSNATLHDAIRKAPSHSACDYCGASDPEVMVGDMDDVIGAIGEGLSSEFNDSTEELPYDQEDGVFIGETFDTRELLELIREDIGIEDVLEDVVRAFGNRQWCERDYFILKPADALVVSWDQFSELVRYVRRFLFLRHDGDEYDREPHEVAPAEILDRIGNLVQETSLIRVLDVNTVLFRLRPHLIGESFSAAVDLGTSPRAKCFSNRMSPAGIPLFYGSLEQETCFAEVWPSPESGQAATLGEFKLSRPVAVIDLAALPAIPSIFDEGARQQRSSLKFLHRFVERITDPITVERTDREVVDYVPSQIVSEYFRTVFSMAGGQKVDGLLYRSARARGGTNVALFVEQDDCVDKSSGGERLELVLQTARRFTDSPITTKQGHEGSGGLAAT